MSKPRVFPSLAQFVAATADSNMTKVGYVAVTAGVAAMVLLTVDPAYEAAHRWIDAVLWACLAFFVFEWVVRLRMLVGHIADGNTRCPAAGCSTAVSATAIPLALILGASSKSAWLFGIFWMLKVVPGFPIAAVAPGCWCWNPDRS